MSGQALQDKFAAYRRLADEVVRTELESVADRGDFMDAMRRIKRKEEQKIYQRQLKNELGFEDMLLALSALAESCLQMTYEFERRALQTVYGSPNCHFHMVAMGKFGGCEMTIHSDLDLIFLFEKPMETTGPKKITNQEYFARLVQRIISNLSLLTQWGRTYSVDTELRPSGRAGILVSSWASFEDYHRKHARIWEKQALLKARPIEPEIAVRDSVSQRLEAQIWNRDYGVKAAKEIHKIRLRMETELAKEDARYYNIKVGSGGIVDIEFAVQYLQLRHGGRVLAVRSPHTLTALRCLASENLLNEAIADELETSYIFYRKVETCLRHRAQRSVGAMPRQHGEELAMLAKSLEKKSELLLQEFEERRRKVREYYLEILGL